MKRILTILAAGLMLINPVAMAAPSVAPKANPVVEENSHFLTLTEAIGWALRDNHDIKMATQRIEDSQLQVSEATAQGLPQLSMTASYGRQDPINLGSSSGGGGLGSNPQLAAFLGLASVNSFSSRITLSQVLFAGFRIVDGVRLAQINMTLTEEGVKKARQEVTFQVVNAYFNALKAAQIVNVDRETLAQAQAQQVLAEKRLQAGTGIKLDVLQTQNQVIRVQQTISRDMNSFNKAKMALNLLMGREADVPIELNPVAKVQEVNTKLDTALKQALENRSELRQSRLNKEMSELNATIQARAAWPTITANAVYNLQDNQVVTGNNQNNQTLTYSLNMNWPIFDGLLASSRAQRSQQTAIQAQIQLDQQQQRVILEVKQAFMDITEAKERLLMAKEGLTVANENVRIAQISYEQGVGINQNVIDAHVNLLQARTAVLNAEFDIYVGKAKLYNALALELSQQFR